MNIYTIIDKRCTLLYKTFRENATLTVINLQPVNEDLPNKLVH